MTLWSEWIDWAGGECPLDEGVAGQVRFRSGYQEDATYGWDWSHRSVLGDIVAYRYDLASDGWIEWSGGRQPVEDDVAVEVMLGNDKFIWAAGGLYWFHLQGGKGGDILAYRVVAKEKPKMLPIVEGDIDDRIYGLDVVADNDNAPPVYDHAAALNLFATDCHAASRRGGWYTDVATGKAKDRNVPEMLCLIHSEISEAMEGYRKGLMDDKLPDRKMIEVELADALIRIGDLATYLGLDVGGAVVAKMAYNSTRADHSIEVRKAVGGKAF